MHPLGRNIELCPHGRPTRRPRVAARQAPPAPRGSPALPLPQKGPKTACVRDPGWSRGLDYHISSSDRLG